MKRLTEFLIENSRVKWIIFIISLYLMLVYFCALVVALFYFWGAGNLDERHSKYDRKNGAWFINFETRKVLLFVVILGDQLFFLWNIFFNLILIYLSRKT